MEIGNIIKILKNDGVCEYGEGEYIKIARGEYELRDSIWSRFKKFIKRILKINK